MLKDIYDLAEDNGCQAGSKNGMGQGGFFVWGGTPDEVKKVQKIVVKHGFSAEYDVKKNEVFFPDVTMDYEFRDDIFIK